MLDFLVERPMLTSAIFSSAVSVLAYYSETALFIIGIFLCVLVVVLLVLKAKTNAVVCAVAVLLVCCSCMLTLGKIEALSIEKCVDCTGEFVVISEAENYGEYSSVALQALETDVLEKGVKIIAFYDKGIFDYGNIIKAEISLESLQSSQNKIRYYSEEIYLAGTIKEGETTLQSDVALSTASRVREYVKRTLFSNLSYNEAATLCAITLGDISYLTNKFYSCVKSAGVSHVMVVSGMHLSVIVSLVTRVSEKLFYNKYFRAILILFSVIVMCAVCGFTRSIIRASVTYLLSGTAVLLERVSTPENTLSAAFMGILITSPFVIFSISFQLSVLSTFGILAVALPLADFIRKRQIIKSKLLQALISLAAVSLSALIFTLPIVIYVFGYVSTVSVATNLLIGSAVSLALMAAVTALVISTVFPLLAKPFFLFANAVTFYINKVIEHFGSLPFAAVRIPRSATVIAVLLILCILYLLLACKRRINMIKLDKTNQKILAQGGFGYKWRQFTRRLLKKQ